MSTDYYLKVITVLRQSKKRLRNNSELDLIKATLFFMSAILKWRDLCDATDIEDITRWREDMNFMFEWQEQYLTSERSERVGYCSCHENIKFISSS